MDNDVGQMHSPSTIKKNTHALQGGADRVGPLPTLKPPSFDAFRQQAEVLEKRERIARLLRAFSSPRKRLGLTPDELLIFFAIGYLGTTTVSGAIQVSPIGMTDISSLLGIPKETVRRKIIRLVDLNYVESTPKGVFVRDIKIWCQMLERAMT